MEEEIISVIIPVYNTESFLGACLDSVLSQSYRNTEIILINDGSTDFSLKIAQSYSEKEDRIKVFSYNNQGLSEARNHGLEVATGDYIVFLDSDDLLLPDALEVMLETLREKNADIVEGKTVRGKIFESIKNKSKIEIKEYNRETAIEDVLYQASLLSSVCGKLFKKQLFDGLRFEKGILYEDLNIICRVLERCNKIILIDYPVYFYRQTDGSILSSWKIQRLDVLKVTENIETYIEENYPNLLDAARNRRLSANFNMFALCSKNKESQHAIKCWETIKENRTGLLFNKKVRLKNKSGIILSYMGKRIFSLVARKVYH